MLNFMHSIYFLMFFFSLHFITLKFKSFPSLFKVISFCINADNSKSECGGNIDLLFVDAPFDFI